MPRKPVVPPKLKQSLEKKRFEGAQRVAKPKPRTVPSRQGASRGPRG